MEYKTIEQARDLPGLRLVLTADVPGPWGESAKAILHWKGIEYIPVRQEAGEKNAELRAWTGQNSAPVAVLDQQPPRCTWLGLLLLAESLAPGKPLLPADLEQRALVVGLSGELAGEGGLAWNRRLQMLAPLMRHENTPAGVQRMAHKYGWSESACAVAGGKVAACLDYFSTRLRMQQRLQSDYLVGASLTAVDIYLANFLAMVKPLPPEQNPMPEFMRASYESVDPELKPHLDPLLFEYRDEMYRRHIKLPLDF
jgi:glutathione S-transferase